MMAKKKNLKSSDIVTMYMDYVLEHNKRPNSVYSFSKSNNFEEALFYEHYGSFKALEQSIFGSFFDHTMDILEKSKDYQLFEARNKLLSFYFTFFEILTANRSFVNYILAKQKSKLQSLELLRHLRRKFTSYIKELDIQTLDLKQETLQKIQTRTLQESAWIQLVMTMKFWLEDTSSSFEKTDIFIEKSVNTSFDLINVAPLNSVIDLGKFLFKEKMHMN